MQFSLITNHLRPGFEEDYVPITRNLLFNVKIQFDDSFYSKTMHPMKERTGTFFAKLKADSATADCPQRRALYSFRLWRKKSVNSNKHVENFISVSYVLQISKNIYSRRGRNLLLTSYLYLRERDTLYTKLSLNHAVQIYGQKIRN